MVVKNRSGHNRICMRRISRPRISGINATATVALFVFLAMSAVSCHWLRYHDLVRTHVDLMERIATDVGDAKRLQSSHPEMNQSYLPRFS